MSDDGTVQVRSYSVCFKLERRLHKIDRWRIPVPHGVPLKGLGYALGTLLAVLVLGNAPVIGGFLGSLHPVYRFIVVPAAVGWAMIRWTIDGRSAAATGLAWVRFRMSPRRLVAFRPTPAPGPVVLGDVTIAPDERSARCRRGVVEGAGQLLLRYPSTLEAKGNTLSVTQRSDAPLWRGKQVRLEPGQRVVVA